MINKQEESTEHLLERDYENVAMMMFGLGIHDRLEFGEELIKNSKGYDVFEDELENWQVLVMCGKYQTVN